MKVPAAVPAVVPFSFESHQVRTLEIDNELWLVAKDIAETLGYKNPREAIRKHCKYAKPVGGAICSPPLDPQTAIIPRGDAYRLIIKSTLPAADKFERWLMDVVVPAIHKTGSYSAAPAVVAPSDPMQILKLTFDALTQVNSRVDEIQSSVTTILDSVRLHQWQCYELKAAATQKAQEFRDTYKCTYALLFPGIWGFVKRHFRVATYSAIPAVRFDEALAIVKSLTFSNMPDYVRESAGGAK
jgi:prophage antirepressor-like protein